jgi:hypothetical protein
VSSFGVVSTSALPYNGIRQTPGTFAIAPFGRLLRPAAAYGDGYSNPPIPWDLLILFMKPPRCATWLHYIFDRTVHVVRFFFIGRSTFADFDFVFTNQILTRGIDVLGF